MTGMGFDVEAVLRQARARGADEAELFFEATVDREFQVFGGRPESLSEVRARGLGVRVVAGGRPGFAYTTDLEVQGVLAAVEEALANARLLPPDPYLALPDPGPAGVEPDAFYSPALAGTPMERKVEMALELERMALSSDPRVRNVTRVLYSDTDRRVVVANSRGVGVEYRTSEAALQLSLVMGDGDQVQTGNGYGYARAPADLDLRGVVAQARDEASAMLGGCPVPSARVPVVFSPRAGALLLSVIARAATAEAVYKRRSFLPATPGAQVASPLVTLVDDGLLPQGHRSAPHDAEGVPCGRVEVVKEGVLASLLYDTRSGRRAGRPSTGNSRRTSFRDWPDPSSTNFYLAPGRDDPRSMVAGVEEGLYLMDLTGLSVGGANPATGDLSVAAGGRWIRRGRLERPVREVTVSGSLGELLRGVDAVGDDLQFLPLEGFWGSPSFRVKALVVSGT
ncbi:MAG: TldD/PmbA family protein [Acetobacteraceae bacterium]|nr:TldD/PmbA family protein [Acetobacteraceae bacterium]